MNGRTLAIITTRLPPATCGIGAHSLMLRRHWPEISAPVEFLVVEGAEESRALDASDRITQFDGDGAKLARELARLGAADVVLHYAGRAFHRFGCPIWMPRVLANRKRKYPGGRLLVFVHEMPGDFVFTSHHSWLGRVNSWILRRLAATADVVVTNTEAHRRKLLRISRRSDIHLVPVGSNIASVGGDSISRLRTEFVLFGLSFGRWQTLGLFDHHLRRWRSAGRLTKLHIIGPGGDEFTGKADRLIAQWADPTIAIRHGVLPSAEVSHLLHGAQFALTNVTAETWSKSGAFMACAANGCAPVILGPSQEAIPLSYAILSDDVETVTDAELTRRRNALGMWYRENAAWPVVAKRLAALLAGEVP